MLHVIASSDSCSRLEIAATILFESFEAVLFGTSSPTAEDAQDDLFSRMSLDTPGQEAEGINSDGLPTYVPTTPSHSHFDRLLHELPSPTALSTNPDFHQKSHSLIEQDFLVRRASSHVDLSPHQARRRARSNLHPKDSTDACGSPPGSIPLPQSPQDAESFSWSLPVPSSASFPAFPSNHRRDSSISSITTAVNQSLQSWRNSWSTANDQALAEMEEPQTPRQMAEARQRDLFLLVL